MSLSLSVSELFSDLAADATAIKFDLPEGGYDRLHAFLESSRYLPQTKQGRLTIVALVLLASRMLKQQLGTLGPIANYINELGEDAVREEAKRILESVNATMQTQRGGNGPGDPFWELDDDSRDRLLKLYETLDTPGRERLRVHLTRTTVLQLATLARLTPEQQTLVLDLFAPPAPQPRKGTSLVGGVIGAFNAFAFPWMRKAS